MRQINKIRVVIEIGDKGEREGKEEDWREDLLLSVYPYKELGRCL